MVTVKSEGKRAEKARQTRRRMLDAARDLFIERGYGATSLQDVAELAGVATQTLYYTFGNKRSLLKELVDVSVAGDDEPIATMDRPWFREAVAADTADALLKAHVHGASEVLGRVAAVIEVVRAASATDPEIASLSKQEPDPRLVVQTAVAEALVAKSGAREGISVEYAADVIYGILSPELYLLLVRDRGWAPEQWERFAYEALRAQLSDV
jgi:AcrR family transcriptional regulator